LACDVKERTYAYIRVEGVEVHIWSRAQNVTKGSRKLNSEELQELWSPNTLGSQTKEGEVDIK
jgi:hypothetical protein